MESMLGTNLVRVERLNRPIRCKLCVAWHRKCDGLKPRCSLCLKNNKDCITENEFIDNRINRVPILLCLQPSKVAKSFTIVEQLDHVIFSTSRNSTIRFNLRRYIIPLSTLLPVSTLTGKVLEISYKLSSRLLSTMEPKVPMGVNYSSGALCELKEKATRSFFYYFNPFMPLFSEKEFLAKPRSELLKVLVTRIGLDYIERSELAVDLTTQANKMTHPELLLRLPPSLDTLQCLLLVLLGVRHSLIEPKLTAIRSFTSVVMSMLGFPVSPSTRACWLERRLALNASSLGIYLACRGRDLYYAVLRLADNNLESVNLKSADKYYQNNSSRKGSISVENRLHFVLSQYMINNLHILFAAYKTQDLCLRRVVDNKYLIECIKMLLGKMRKNLKTAWSIFDALPLNPNQSETLVRQSKTMLYLRYHTDCIKLMEVASYINPKGPNLPVLLKPYNISMTAYIYIGLLSALSLIDIVSSLNSLNFNFNSALLLNSACTFIAAYCKPVKSEAGTLISRYFLKACDFLAKVPESNKLYMDAITNLELLRFISKRLTISI